MGLRSWAKRTEKISGPLFAIVINQGLIGKEMTVEELFVDTDPGDAGGDEGHY